MKTQFATAIAIALYLQANTALAEPDVYEVDDTAETANLIVVNDETPQLRTFHDDADQDWFKFAVRAGVIYTIELRDVGDGIDPILTPYGFDGQVMNWAPIDDRFEGEGEGFEFEAEQNGIFFAKLSQAIPRLNENNIGYSLVVFEPTAGFAGPDLQVTHQTDYTWVNRGSGINLSIEIENLGGQFPDTTAENVLLRSYFGAGMSISDNYELPSECVLEDQGISCSLQDILDQDKKSIDIQLTGQSLGRRSVISTAKSFDDDEQTKPQPDDRPGNNEVEVEYTVAERANFGTNIRADKSAYDQHDRLELYAKVETISEDLALGTVTVYLTVELTDGTVIYLEDLGDQNSSNPTPKLSNSPTPLLGAVGWAPYFLVDTKLLAVPELPELPVGEYTWSLIFAKPGTDVRDPSNHISNVSFTHTVGTL